MGGNEDMRGKNMGENKVMGKKVHWGTMRAWVKIARESIGTWVSYNLRKNLNILCCGEHEDKKIYEAKHKGNPWLYGKEKNNSLRETTTIH